MREVKDENISFTLNEEESRRAKAFADEHVAHAHQTAFGESVRFIIAPTAMGDLVKIHCLSCGAVQDITDYSKF